MMISVSVAYADPKKQIEIPLEVEESATVALAIRRSGILQQFPEIHLAHVKVGIWGKAVRLDACVHAGDRIEIYRPLVRDPKEARLLRMSSLSSWPA